MHKHIVKGVVAATLLLVAGLCVPHTSAADTLNWINSNLIAQKQADTTSLPVTLGGYGNIDCAQEDIVNCSVPTNYGAATSNSTVRITSSGKFSPVITYMDGRQHFFPAPNSDIAISYYSGPVYGLYLAFNYSFMSVITRTGGSYTINRLPDGRLADKTNHLLPADITSMSFSENGRWMIVSSPNLAILRVDLQTFEVVPFATGFNYTIGLDPSAKTAISNDGRYAVVSSNNFSTFKVYDITSCSTVPNTITGPVSCQSRDLRNFMQGSVSGFNFMYHARFMNSDILAAYASYKSGLVSKTARFIISTKSLMHQHDLLALGDSYISGEGAFDYIGGTDTDINKCHVSFMAYPHLIGKDLNYESYHSVACSGAMTRDIADSSSGYAGQADHIKRADRTAAEIDSIISSFLPGYINQLEFVKNYQPQVVTISIGGNDMGFAQVLKNCVDPRKIQSCYNSYEDRLELVREINTIVYPRLVQTYQQIKAAGPPDMRVYVVGYPQVAKPSGDCGLNVHLNSDEILLSQKLINYLDTVVYDAAAKVGLYYVDAQDALYGFRLCEAGPGASAVNGLTAGNDTSKRLGGPIGNESYHPTAFGYQLLENKILATTHNLTSPMPSPDLTVALPSEADLEILNITHSGRTINTRVHIPDMAPDLVYQQVSVYISVGASETALSPLTTVTAELHSTPISLGSFKTDTSGGLSAQITVPFTVLAGYHTLHLFGINLLGQPVDIYKDIYVASSAEDLDGNGVLDGLQQCVWIMPSGQDSDKDGIDDACDANITQPPAKSNKTPSISTVPPATQPHSISAAIVINDADHFLDLNTIRPALDDKPFINQSRLRAAGAAYADSSQTGLSNTDIGSGTNSFIIGSFLIILGGLGLFYRRNN